MTEAPSTQRAADVASALAKLRSLHAIDAGIVEAVACGSRAIPALRNLLLSREPSGIYQPRCGAVRALAMLGADDMLFDFLASPPEAADAVERMGDDAVINAAALALSATGEERVFTLLLDLASRRYWPGVIEGLAAFRRREAIPYLLGALADDDCRALAKPALHCFGAEIRPALLEIAIRRGPPAHAESETSLRTRQAALSLAIEIGIPPSAWPGLRPLMADPAPRIAVLALDLCLTLGAKADWPDAIACLIALLQASSWKAANDAEDCLVRHYAKAEPLIRARLSTRPQSDDGDPYADPLAHALRRIARRAAREKP